MKKEAVSSGASPKSPGLLNNVSLSLSGNGKVDSIALQSFSGYFLIACLVFSFIGLFFLVKPFLVILVFAVILASVFHPVYNKVLSWVGNRSGIASFLTCLLIFVVIILPLTFFAVVLFRQALDTSNLVFQKVQSGELDPYLRWEKGNWLYDFLQMLQSQVGTVIDFEKIDLKAELVNFVKTISTFMVQESAVFLKGIGSILSLVFGFFVMIFVMFFALFYFLKDSDALIQKVMLLSPLPEKYDRELLRKFSEISKATLNGIFLTSIIQGCLGGIGFAIVGIPNAIFWGTAMAFFSLIPVVGTALIWAPAAAMLLMSGNVVGGIILLLFGVLLISSVDNFLRVFFIGNQMNMNPLIAFLAVFGGFGLFGPVGVIFGPLILMAFFTFLHIYQLEYKTVLKK